MLEKLTSEVSVLLPYSACKFIIISSKNIDLGEKKSFVIHFQFNFSNLCHYAAP